MEDICLSQQMFLQWKPYFRHLPFWLYGWLFYLEHIVLHETEKVDLLDKKQEIFIIKNKSENILKTLFGHLNSLLEVEFRHAAW